MRSRSSFRMSARSPCAFPAGASTAARSSAICRRPSSSACAIPRSVRLSRAISSHARLAAMPDRQAAWRFLEQSDLIASADEIQAAVRRVAAQLTERLGESYPLVLVVMGGAVVFAGQLLPLLRFPLDLDYVHASRYGNETRGARTAGRETPPAAVRGRSVLVLDDILDGGQTLAAIRERLLELGAASFHSAVLVEKRLRHAKPIRADFVGLEIADRFVFGYGMDAKGYWRNLPEIRAMRES